MNFNNIFKNKTVLITGHTGFKGSWLVAWLKLLEAKVIGISLDLPTKPSHFEVAKIYQNISDLRIDIRDYAEVKKTLIKSQPDFVFHLAAQPLVRQSYKNPIETWNTNVIGTLNVLEALREIKKLCIAVFITSDKCYRNYEWEWGYRETDALGGTDPYSASKASAEHAINSYVKSFFIDKKSSVRIASARAGNVIGGGDWSPNRIVPDCIKAWSKNKEAELRNPNSTRPWQHVLESLSGYLTLAMNLSNDTELHGESFNFGPPSKQNKSVLELVKLMSKYWNKVSWRDTSKNISGPYEANLLKLNCDKALHHLSWQSVMNFDDTVRLTAEWYKDYFNNPNQIINTTNYQIEYYTESANNSFHSWV